MLIFSLLLNMQSHPTWVRGLKLIQLGDCIFIFLSHPTWVRGLKLLPSQISTQCLVAPYVGAWIETQLHRLAHQKAQVAPYVGAWIETFRGYRGRKCAPVAPYVGAWIET